ncbi:DUF5658 family protein [Metabacillus halosaccharovorans]|uniref:DUF5658 family protein n=1 Tax=Metabacillus halosaccharovorans TaxID=930124 RepID=UPI000994F7C7|nr:DUF5658 family protein [Metabacillus halosaccharovorans]
MKMNNNKRNTFVKRICYYLAFLNLIDGILTYIGLKLNLIEEANVLMRIIYEAEPVYFLIVKTLLSILLFALCILQKIPNNFRMKTISYIGASLYTFVLFIHFYWIVDII